jgi:uncharacterized protein YpmB
MKLNELLRREEITEHQITMMAEYNNKNIKEVCYYDNEDQNYNYGIFINNEEIVKFKNPIGEDLQTILKIIFK